MLIFIKDYLGFIRIPENAKYYVFLVREKNDVVMKVFRGDGNFDFISFKQSGVSTVIPETEREAKAVNHILRLFEETKNNKKEQVITK